MQTSPPSDRRRFLRLATGFTTGMLLSGCGGGSAAATGDAIAVVPGTGTGAGPVATPAAPAAPGTHPLNLALNLAYLGSAFYGFAARGTGLATTLTAGVGRAGVPSGARVATFTDPAIAGYAAELADDKQAQVVALRAEMGSLAAAQPAMDLSALSTGAFSQAAQRAGIVASGAPLDPYADDGQFLIGAFLIENMVAAAQRSLLISGADAASPLGAAHLADAIYHGGLIRSLIDAREDTDRPVAAAIAKATRLSATLDGTATGDHALSDATGPDADILDADGRAIPFTRDTRQVLRVLYMADGSAGGFLPAGANGLA